MPADSGSLLAKKTIQVIDHEATGASMRKRRKATGKMLTSVAKTMGIADTYLSDLELGKRSWTEYRAAEFLKALKK